eukprot:m.4597 g.4597  ORF g.4597 m.4597 type:complete len:882 (+) comp3936_c0_seq1:57-2702(+)
MMFGGLKGVVAVVAVFAALCSVCSTPVNGQGYNYTCVPPQYDEPCGSMPALLNRDFHRFHTGVTAFVFAVVGLLFLYRLVSNFKVVLWRQSTIYFAAFICCIFNFAWLVKDVRLVQDLRAGVPYEVLTDLTLTVVVCTVFGYIMRLDDEVRQKRVHWRIIVQWILICAVAVGQLVQIYTARALRAQETLWLSFICLFVLALVTADRSLLLMKLLPATQRSTVPWFRKVNFVAFFLAVAFFGKSMVAFYHAVDEEVKVAEFHNPHTYQCYPIEFLTVKLLSFSLAPLFIILTALWDDPRTVLAVKRLENRKKNTVITQVDAFISRYWRTATMIVVISLATLSLAGWGGSATCLVPHASVGLASLFMARVGATPFYVLFPVVFVMILHGFTTSLESTILGSFLPRANGSLLLYHKYVGWLCLIATLFHVGGHFGTIHAYLTFKSAAEAAAALNTTTTSTTTAPGVTPPAPISDAVVTYFEQLTNVQGGLWLLPWLTGILMTFLMFVVVIVYYVYHKRNFTMFKKWHVWSSYIILFLGIFHGLGMVLGTPWLWLIFVIVAFFSLLDYIWCRVKSETVNTEMFELTTTGTRGRLEVVVIMKWTCKKLKFYPGDYLLLRVPQISVSDEHPFTIVTNVPENEYELHIKVSDLKVNAWTRALTSMLDFKYNRIVAGHSYQLTRESQSELEEGLLEHGDSATTSDSLPSLIDKASIQVKAEIIGGFKSSLADGDFLNSDYVIMVAFSVGATPMLAYLNRLPESRYEDLRDNVWFFHRSETYIVPGKAPGYGAYGVYAKDICEETERRIGRDPNGSAGPIMQNEAGESRGAFWKRLHDRVEDCLRNLPQGGRISIGYCGSLRGLDSLYDSLDQGKLAANKAIKFFIESFG